MLICPSCQFENTDKNRVCQRCGQSLRTWYALCLPHPSTREPVSIGPYLDPNQRYRIPNSQATTLHPLQPTAMLVVDGHPTKASPLQELQTAWLENPQLKPRHSLLTEAIPTQAFPYLALQTDYFPAVPEIHDAFYTSSHDILLIEDRTSWVSLQSRWQQESHSLHRIQWLFEIVLLWEALASWQMEVTLLHPGRLTINDDGLLCLTQLDLTPDNKNPKLKSLGQVWQQMFLEHSAQTTPPALAQIIHDLTMDRVSTIGQLKEALATWAEQSSCGVGYRADSDNFQPSLNSMPLSGDLADNSPTSMATESQSSLSLTLTDEALIQLAGAHHDLESPEDMADDKSDSPESPTMVLPMKLVQIDEVGQSHVGMQRNHNEDYFFAQTASTKVDTVDGPTLTSRGLYIVCDGMGGHASGEVASQLAVKALREFFALHWQQELPDEATLTRAVATANQAIYDINQANATSGLGRMGTTLVMLLIHNLEAVVVHVGDSRLYSYCKRFGLRQLTLDHEVGQREINRGIEPAIAYARPDAYQLTQALGPRSQHDIQPSITYHEISEDTLFLLCSDGLSDHDLLERHEDRHIAPLLSSRANLEAGLAELIDLANEKNGHDNITAILTRLKLRPDIGVLPD